MKALVALICGILFGVGLTVSQMVNPNKVLNFLDVLGQWDPSLALVMVGGIGVFSLGYRVLVKPANKPVWGETFNIPTRADIDKPLLIGAIMFGLGWGLSGICPGPAISNLSGAEPKIFAFIAMMIISMKAAPFIGKITRATSSRNSG